MTNPSLAVTKLTDWARKPEILSGIVVGEVIGPVEGVTVVREPPTGGTVVEDASVFDVPHPANNTRARTTPAVTPRRGVSTAAVRHAPRALCIAPPLPPSRFPSPQGPQAAGGADGGPADQKS